MEKRIIICFLFISLIIFNPYVFGEDSATKNKIDKGIDLEQKIEKTPWLGLITKDYYKEKIKSKETDGVLVDDFIDKSPATISGFNKGDIIKSIDGQPVKSQDEFTKLILNKKVGEKIKIKLLRKGRETEMEITLEDIWYQVKIVLDTLGFKVKVVDVPEKKVNIVISSVKPDSVAEKANINKGDLILGVNRKPFNNLNEFGQVTSEVKLNETVFITVFQNDNKVLTKGLNLNEPAPKKN